MVDTRTVDSAYKPPMNCPFQTLLENNGVQCGLQELHLLVQCPLEFNVINFWILLAMHERDIISILNPAHPCVSVHRDRPIGKTMLLEKVDCIVIRTNHELKKIVPGRPF
jgi:hypothetical protein